MITFCFGRTPFVFSVSVCCFVLFFVFCLFCFVFFLFFFCFQIFILKLNLRSKIGLTYAIAIVKSCFAIFVSDSVVVLLLFCLFIYFFFSIFFSWLISDY